MHLTVRSHNVGHSHLVQCQFVLCNLSSRSFLFVDLSVYLPLNLSIRLKSATYTPQVQQHWERMQLLSSEQATWHQLQETFQREIPQPLVGFGIWALKLGVLGTAKLQWSIIPFPTLNVAIGGYSLFSDTSLSYPVDYPMIYIPINILSGWWSYTYPSEKYESQLGWLFPYNMKQ